METLRIHSFVHLPLDLAQRVWLLVLHKRCEGNEMTARALFKSRLWYWGDLEHCDHDLEQCVCTVCHDSRLCSHPGCGTHPVFNFPGAKPGIRCGPHKEPGMVNVTNKVCEYDGCTTQPSFNFPGAKPGIRCGPHKEPGMVNVMKRG